MRMLLKARANRVPWIAVVSAATILLNGCGRDHEAPASADEGAAVPVDCRAKPGPTVRPKEMTLYLADGVTLELVLIPAGEFMMGSPESEAGRFCNEGPQHKVTFSRPFYMGKCEVTWTQWRAAMGSPLRNGRLSGPHEPVVTSWFECRDFCKRLSKTTGYAIRLPSEAEWEYACRAGTTTPFHFGETISTSQANFTGQQTYGTERKGVHRGGSTQVGSFPANAWGLHDMHGNVYEWCGDCFHNDYAITGKPTDGTAWTTGDDMLRVTRGGGCMSYWDQCRSASRSGVKPGAERSIGFRVVLE